MATDVTLCAQVFSERFGGEARVIAWAPGRVNLIGEHTDYNHGFVLPMAIERDTVIVGRALDRPVLRLRAENLNDEGEFPLESICRQPQAPWADYPLGVALELQRLGHRVSGAEAVIMGDVPLGCGLSSSAALEMAALAFFEGLGDFRLDDAESARLGQRVENGFLGLSSGIMDQFVSRCGKADHALFLDCRSLERWLVPVVMDQAVFVIANTNCPRGLTGSKYNERVAECGEAVRILRETTGRDGTHLRDFTEADLEAARGRMSEVVYRRARHVITENARTREACEALSSGDLPRFGSLMNASDRSLREDYEVTNLELDAMTSIARSLPGCLGSRMTGAGFGGCTVSLVLRDEAERFCAELSRRYQEATGRVGETYVTRAADGAGVKLV